jgi:hypothetical protein
MKIVAAAFLALIALFIGGCSARYVWDSIHGILFPFTDISYVYSIVILVISVTILAFALLIGWGAWCIYKGTMPDTIQDTGGVFASAYDDWLSLGNVGTEQEFIDSLQSEDGDADPDLPPVVGKVWSNLPVEGKVGFNYRGHRVVVNNDFYFFDGQNFQSDEAVKAHIDSYLTDP